MLNVIPIPAFTDNYIWLILNSENNQAAVVDPGDATPVLSYCEQNNITLSDILITHHHPDHTGGIEELAGHYNITVYGPAAESIACCEHPLREEDQITLSQLDDLTFNVLDIPGHTSGHIAYEGNGWLFCGDTLFAGGCGRIFEGTPAQMHHSLSKLAALDPQTLVFCGHEYTLANLEFALSVNGNNQDLIARIEREQRTRSEDKPTLPSIMDIELKTNPFLRANDPEIIQAAEQYRQQQLTDPVAVFAATREMKDSF